MDFYDKNIPQPRVLMASVQPSRTLVDRCGVSTNYFPSNFGFLRNHALSARKANFRQNFQFAKARWVLKRCETLEEADAYAPVPDNVDDPLIPPIISKVVPVAPERNFLLENQKFSSHALISTPKFIRTGTPEADGHSQPGNWLAQLLSRSQLKNRAGWWRISQNITQNVRKVVCPFLDHLVSFKQEKEARQRDQLIFMLLDVSSQGTNGRCSQISLAGNAYVEFQSQNNCSIEPKFLDPYLSKFRQGMGWGLETKLLSIISTLLLSIPMVHVLGFFLPCVFMVDLKPQKIFWTYFWS